ncbi:hypothetical protein CSKR_113729 [Clonorchis sinensis]|uniref:Uncharacterized protein n=1 Tax=Clonorchis sinensis TaxID=79923 RepID=A0A3R7GPV4_CLOSI|nr:hypothetical protein CSKR_113729 [Clonorchis sinensis]
MLQLPRYSRYWDTFTFVMYYTKKAKPIVGCRLIFSNLVSKTLPSNKSTDCYQTFPKNLILFIFTPLWFERSSSCSGVIIPSSSAVHIQWPCRDLNPGHLTCEASVLPLLHQRTLDASEFSRLNRRTCSHLSDVICVPDPSNDDPVTVLVVTID